MNTLSREAFVSRYGGIYEHSPWVAEQCFDKAAAMSAAELTPIFAACVDEAPRDQQLALIRAHPDLAGRAAIAGDLTASSSDEQSSAGIDRCSPEEYAEFQELNERYKSRFGFPFVMAVRNSNREEILAAFRSRVDNAPDQEFRTAIDEIHKIARLRLRDL